MVLDNLQRQQDEGKALELFFGYRKYNITSEVFVENKRFYKQFTKPVDYKIRVERTMMSIYSNDLGWITAMKRIAESPIEFWRPDKAHDAWLTEPNVILVRQPTEFEFKVTLSSVTPADPGLANWIRANPDKAKTTDKCLEIIETKQYPRGQYIYVRDQKVLNLMSFMLNKMGRVDKLVYVDDEDK